MKVLNKSAVARDLVLLPDGQTGRLVYVSPVSRKAKVRVGGLHRRLPVDQLIIINPSSTEEPS